MLVLGWLIRRRLGNYLTWAWSRDTVRVLLAAVLMTGVVLSVAAHPADKPGGWPFGSLLAEVSAITRLAVGSIVGGLTYVLMLWGLGYGLCSNVRSITGIGQD
jgi:peptidoglycan biosynthesis protein MviN/MurJ (putative lipid II flippase)